MKKLIHKIAFSLVTVFGAFSLTFAQNTSGNADDLGKIALTTYIPDQVEALDPIAANMLTNKLNQICSANGISSSFADSRFIITANSTVLTKDLIASAPPMTALTLEVTLYIGDGLDGKKFSSQTLSLKGVGTNENKAYIEALKTIKPNDPAIQNFVSNSKTKIIAYYNSRCAQIIKEAQTLENLKLYDEAMYKLLAVPAECTDCYTKSMAAIAPIFKKKIDTDCKIKLAEATNLWNANQNVETANAIGEIMATIQPDAACYKEVKELSNKIGKRVLEIDNREWNYKMETEVNLERDRIKAYRDVGVAFGNGQPKTVTYNVIGWW